MIFRTGPIRNLDKVQAFLRTVPRGAVSKAIEAIARYLVGDKRHGFKHDDPYKRTTRAATYGRQWESDAQRAYVMAKIRDGSIILGQRARTPTAASGGYYYKMTRGGYGATIHNDQPGAYWTRVWGKWPRWRGTKQVIEDNIKGAIRSGVSVVNAFLRSKGRA